MRLQGVPVEVHDIDIQTNKQGAYAIEEALNGFVSQPVCFVESGNIRSHFGKLLMSGIAVEIMGDIQKRLESGNWEQPVDITLHRCWAVLGDLCIPVLDLTYEYEAYRKMGRVEKAELLFRWLADNKGD
jgi:hypothetical protein